MLGYFVEHGREFILLFKHFLYRQENRNRLVVKVIFLVQFEALLLDFVILHSQFVVALPQFVHHVV